MTETHDLDVLDPAAATLTIGDTTVSVTPLRIGQLPAFLRALRPVLAALGDARGVDWLGLLATHGEQLLDAVAIAVGRPRPWVDELPADDAVRLVAAVIDVNADFLTRRLLPQVAALPLPAGLAVGPGSTPSSG